jgi:short subunit dehydrogenase-like uncharacterized protein
MEKRMKIAVYGASGFTGGLVVAELTRRGVTPVLAGRSLERLRTAAAAEAGVPDAETVRAGIGDNALPAAFAGCDAVINCTGPFITSGGAVVRAATLTERLGKPT